MRLIKRKVQKLLKRLPVKNRILFESYPDFDDNTASFYLYLVEKGYDKKYQFIWMLHKDVLSEDERFQGVQKVSMTSNRLTDKIRVLYYTYTAKYFISCNIAMTAVRDGQKAINLTHGWEFKNMKKMNVDYSLLDYVICQGEFWKPIINEQTRISMEKIISTGYPRNDLLFEQKRLEEFAAYSKVIIWMPTYRQHKSAKVCEQEPFPYGIPLIKMETQMEEMNGLLAKYNMLLLIRLHFAQKTELCSQPVYSNIALADEKFLTDRKLLRYELLRATDALITDYSSVYFDYILMDKPIAITLDDYEWGIRHERYSIDNPLDYTKGEYLYTFEQLKEFLTDVREGRDKHAAERETIVKKVIDHRGGGGSSRRLVEFLDL